jgi:hypothetical protein
MAFEDCTVSSLTTELDNLTELHQISGLPTEHYSRRTPSGFLIQADRLPKCIPLPALKKQPRSWVWDHGVVLDYVNDKKEVTKQWLYKICYNKDPPPILSTYMIAADKTTTKAIDYLEEYHQFDRLRNKTLGDASKKRKREFFNAWSDQQDIHNSVFDEEGWKYTYCRWVVSSGITSLMGKRARWGSEPP